MSKDAKKELKAGAKKLKKVKATVFEVEQTKAFKELLQTTTTFFDQGGSIEDAANILAGEQGERR